MPGIRSACSAKELQKYLVESGFRGLFVQLESLTNQYAYPSSRIFLRRHSNRM